MNIRQIFGQSIVFPVRAGVFPYVDGEESETISIPRESGGVSLV